MKYFLIIFISLFIFSCSTTTTYTQEQAEALTTMERCFGINTGLHYWDLEQIDDAGYVRLVESLRKLNPEPLNAVQEICGSKYQMLLTNRRLEEANEIFAERAARRQAIGAALLGLSSEMYRQNQTYSNSNDTSTFKPLRGGAVSRYYNDMDKLVCIYADGYTISPSSNYCPYNP